MVSLPALQIEFIIGGWEYFTMLEVLKLFIICEMTYIPCRFLSLVTQQICIKFIMSVVCNCHTYHLTASLSFRGTPEIRNRQLLPQ